MSNPQKTKKQHTVPECYLNAWKIPGKDSMHVYDSKRNKYRINNINDVASHNFFYDTELVNLLPKEKLQQLLEGKISIRPDADPQIIEHTFANYIEDSYSRHLNRIRGEASRIPCGQASNVQIFNPKQKEEFSEHLTFQLVRTSQYRKSIEESSQCVAQILHDMGIPDAEIKRVTLTSTGAKNAQLRNILDLQDLEKIALSFYSLTWVLCINRTKKKFYTSDNPIAQIEHLHNTFLPNTGLRSPGVEIAFPISPDLLLIMLDGQYHNMAAQDMTGWDCNIENTINYYNEVTALNSETCTISQNGDWHVIEKLLARDPHTFRYPKTRVSWGGKEYTPYSTQKN